MKTGLPTRLLLGLWILGALTGCQATGDPAREPAVEESQESSDVDGFDEFDEFETEQAPVVHDPLIGFNRAMFGFNDWIFGWVWNPVAKGVRYVLPEPARVAVDNFFRNLFTPARLVNSLLQGKFEKAGDEFGRFAVNTTIGVAGLFDLADSQLDWPAPSPEDFGQTLATWGVGEGFPLTLPFLGPLNLRDGIGLIPDGFMNPTYYFTTTPEGLALWVGDELNYTSLHIGEYESLKADALDPYTLFRDAYGQSRRHKIED